MKAPANPPSPSTLHVRNFRERMRSQGLVKKDVWIRPEYAEELSAIEKALREPGTEPSSGARAATDADGAWTMMTIRHALGQTSAVRNGVISLDLIEGAEPSLHLTMHAFGDLSVFIAVGGEQIIVESHLWPATDVLDPVAFNAFVLRTHKLLPLSTIGIQDIGGVASYTMFGALDAHSGLANLMFEIETLADNVIDASDAYTEHLRPLRNSGTRTR